MAENKKSFILYSDLISTVDKLPDEIAGKLFKIILNYVNDKNPVVEDLLLQIAFEPIKLQLKRDLKKFEDKKEKWSEAGKKSAEKRSKNVEKKSTFSTDVKNVEGGSTDSTVNDNVTVNVNDNVILGTEKKCFDIESFLLENRIAFDKICIATMRMPEEVKTEIHSFHLWFTKNNKYPENIKALLAGVESWILNSKNFKNGSTTKANKQNSGLRKIIATGNKEFAALRAASG